MSGKSGPPTDGYRKVIKATPSPLYPITPCKNNGGRKDGGWREERREERERRKIYWGRGRTVSSKPLNVTALYSVSCFLTLFHGLFSIFQVRPWQQHKCTCFSHQLCFLFDSPPFFSFLDHRSLFFYAFLLRSTFEVTKKKKKKVFFL